jgi:hypothetical protein
MILPYKLLALALSVFKVVRDEPLLVSIEYVKGKIHVVLFIKKKKINKNGLIIRLVIFF